MAKGFNSLEKILGSARSTELLKKVIGCIPVPVAIFDQKLRYLACSDEWLEHYKIKERLGEESVIGKTHYEVFPEILTQKPEWIEYHQRALKGEVMKCDYDVFTDTFGKTQILRWRLEPWHNKDEIAGIIMFSEIITDAVNLQNLQYDDDGSLGSDETHQILKAVTHIQSMYLKGVDIKQIFEAALKIMLDLTESEYGFIGQIFNDEQGNYLKTLAITDISWDEKSKKFYDEHAPEGMIFRNHRTLFGYTLRTGKIKIANDPEKDPDSGGMPKGHPPLKKYLGIPFYGSEGLVGMVGLANRKQGYSESTIRLLNPLVHAFSFIIENYMKRHDIKEKSQVIKSMSDEISASREYDKRTGIFSKEKFLEDIQKLNQDEMSCLIMMDIDNLRLINSAFDYEMGNCLIREVSLRISRNLPQRSDVYRIGGDKFAVIVRRPEQQLDVEMLCKKISHDISAYYEINMKTLRNITASMSYVCFQKDITSYDELSNVCEHALERAKLTRPGGFIGVDKPFIQAYHRQKEIEVGLKTALADERIAIAYLPIYRASDNKIVGVEALMRWYAPEITDLKVEEFIQVADRIGELKRMGFYLLNRSLEELGDLYFKKTDLFFNVNLYESQISIFHDVLAYSRLFKAAGIFSERIMIDIPYKQATENPRQRKAVFDELEERGFQICLDQFDASEINIDVCSLPVVKAIKLSRPIIRKIIKKDNIENIEHAISMCHSLDMKIYACGIETKEELNALKALGCEFFQGYYFSGPVNFEGLIALLKNEGYIDE